MFKFQVGIRETCVVEKLLKDTRDAVTCETYLWVVAPSPLSEDPEKSDKRNAKRAVLYKHCWVKSLTGNE